MSLLKMKQADFCFEDCRGSLVQLVHAGYEQINVLKTKEGVVRGGHYHKISNECFYVVSGSVNVSASKNGLRENYLFKAGDFFEIMPYISHSMSFPEDCILVAMYDRCVEKKDGTKDIYPEE